MVAAHTRPIPPAMKAFLESVLPPGTVNVARRWRLALGALAPDAKSSAAYWTQHHVDAPEAGFESVDASLAHLDWRNGMYPGTLDLMPLDDAVGLTVLDYGCGPGNDTIGFAHHSKPKALHAVDVSSTALALAQRRAELHGFDVDFQEIAESPVTLPFDDASFDLVHSAGVLHHTPDPAAILAEFHRVLKPSGRARIMVYNRDSVWMHLHVAYRSMIVQGLYKGATKDDAFRRTTDGDRCPIARAYVPEDFIALCQTAGFDATFAGAGVSLLELECLDLRFAALRDQRLDSESRAFLGALMFNDRLWPLYRGHVAGINGCYHLQRA